MRVRLVVGHQSTRRIYDFTRTCIVPNGPLNRTGPHIFTWRMTNTSVFLYEW